MNAKPTKLMNNYIRWLHILCFRFLSAADLVKFARFPADVSRLERAVAAATMLVERTVPAAENAERETRS